MLRNSDLCGVGGILSSAVQPCLSQHAHTKVFGARGHQGFQSVLCLHVLLALATYVLTHKRACHLPAAVQTVPGTTPVPALQAYRLHSSRVNAANWCLLLAAALALAGSITWLTTMSTALSATQQTGGFGHKPVNAAWRVLTPLLQSSTSTARLPKPPAITAPPAEAAEAVVGSRGAAEGRAAAAAAAAAAGAGTVGQADVGQLWSVRTCPPGCVDLGLIAQVLGLPWPCFCQVWLLGDLIEQLQRVSGVESSTRGRGNQVFLLHAVHIMCVKRALPYVMRHHWCVRRWRRRVVHPCCASAIHVLGPHTNLPCVLVPCLLCCHCRSWRSCGLLWWVPCCCLWPCPGCLASWQHRVPTQTATCRQRWLGRAPLRVTAACELRQHKRSAGVWHGSGEAPLRGAEDAACEQAQRAPR